MSKVKIEIRQIDAWLSTDGDWIWNNSTVIDNTEFEAMVLFDQQFREYIND